MNEKNRTILKSYFETGDRPTQEQFTQLIDSMINMKDDEIVIILPSKNVGIGVPSPKEKLDIGGGIRIGSTTNEVAGIIRWNGTDFEGYDGKEWKSLTIDSLANRSVYMPEPRIFCTADSLYAYWEDCTDKRFLDFHPAYWLYRYKSRIKQTYRDKNKKTRIKPKKWAHTSHQDISSHSNPRNTEFPMVTVPGKKQSINLEPTKWFKPIPGDTTSGYYIPKGQGISPVPAKPFFNRRFEYFRLRTVIRVDNILVFGPFSEIFSLAYRKKYYSDKTVKKYKPVFELVHPGKGMNHNK
jgi:hypothetical protein